MTDQALNAAVARLERAVDRIERSSAGRDQARAHAAGELAALERRHTQLRSRIQETIARLDAMIGEATA